MLTRWILSAAILLLFISTTARTAILPTDLEPKVGADYQPVGSDELAIWQSLERLEEVIRNSPQRVISPVLDAYTRRVVERLIGRPAPELRVYLMHDASLNAAMLPSGMMIVNTGLLARVRNEAQLAAVLAHEAGHYFRRHSLDLHRDLRRKSVIAEAAKSALHSSQESDSIAAWGLINQAIVMSSSRFSRNLESEADAYGLMLMARAGYPPRAASAIWRQVIDERRASAAARNKRYGDGTNSVLSTHPPTEDRMIDLADTADYLAGKQALPDSEGRDEWTEVIRPYQAVLLQEQIQLNDPGASLYLLENLAKVGWTGLLRFNEGEIYRLRNAKGDDLKAAAAYAAATALADAPPEAWRARGFAWLLAGNKSEADEALNRYIAMQPDAPDAAMIRFTVSNNQLAIADEVREIGSDMTVEARSPWKRIPATKNQPRWNDVWTWNGPQIDRVTLVSGMPEGKAIVSQQTNAYGQVPVFRDDMTTQDLMSMVEVSYRVNGVTVFNFESVEPFDFLGGRGVRLRYNYVSGIAFRKEGSCVMRIVDGKLYAMKLESLAGRSFDTVAPEFDRLIDSAELRR
jgi:beta-barrel assembly-enhancing protease